MISKSIRVISAAILPLLLASCAMTGGGAGDTVEFEPSGPGTSLALDPEVRALCKDVLGYDYAGEEIRYWREADISAWVLASKGKHGPIISRTVLENGTVKSCKVLSSKEIRGKKVSSRSFLRQFTGMSLLDSGKLSSRVNAITGATISSNAMRDAVRLALRLDAGTAKN